MGKTNRTCSATTFGLMLAGRIANRGAYCGTRKGDPLPRLNSISPYTLEGRIA